MKIQLLLSILLVSTLGFAKAIEFRAGAGQVMAVDLFLPKEPKQATFLLLPGVNRGLLPTDQAVTKLRGLGFGVALFNLSEQPLSIAKLANNEQPLFLKQNKSLSDLAVDTQKLAKFIRQQIGAESKIIPVSLSYTGAISARLKDFDLIIDVVPMTSSAGANPDLEKYRDSLKLAEFWNPIFGPSVTRSLLDSAYRTKWEPQADKMIEQFDLPKARKEEMVLGYTSLSRASEGFVWPEAMPNQGGTRRIFILAGDDSKVLLKNQLETFSKYLDSQSNALLILVQKSGHVIPSEQPEIYVQILSQIASGELNLKSAVIELTPGQPSQSLVWTGIEAQKQLKIWIEQTEL